jgi:hypothetical protein
VIEIVRLSGVNRVACFCDHCGEEITDAGMALYVWDVQERSVPRFYHKRRCASAADPDRALPWDELTRFALYLERNTGVDRKVAEETAQFLSDL